MIVCPSRESNPRPVSSQASVVTFIPPELRKSREEVANTSVHFITETVVQGIQRLSGGA